MTKKFVFNSFHNKIEIKKLFELLLRFETIEYTFNFHFLQIGSGMQSNSTKF